MYSYKLFFEQHPAKFADFERFLIGEYLQERLDSKEGQLHFEKNKAEAQNYFKCLQIVDPDCGKYQRVWAFFEKLLPWSHKQTDIR